MRLPNGYGTVYKLSGNRYKPWIARKRVGEVIDYARKRVKPIYKTIGYYTTREDALRALGAFNAVTDPSEERAPITVKQLYDLWSAEHYKKIKNPVTYRGVLPIIEPLFDKPFETVKLDDVMPLFDRSGKSAHMKAVCKSMLMQMSDYAVVHELIQTDRRGILRHIQTGDRTTKIVRQIFTPEEFTQVWKRAGKFDDIIILLLHTGVRTSELLNIRAEDVDFDQQCFRIRQAKTKAGVRTVPICDKIVPVMRRYLDAPHRPKYADLYYLMGVEYHHRPHDARHTFTTLCVEKGIDQRVIDAIVGHSPGNLALSVYTHITPAVMLDAVNKVFPK